MPKKTPPFPEWEKWTTARFWQFVRTALRGAFTRWPPKWEVLGDSKRTLTEAQQKRRGVRHKYEYQCAACKKWYKQSQVEVDHIVPVGSLKTYDDLPGFVERMFVGKDKLQVLCKVCHRKKGKE